MRMYTNGPKHTLKSLLSQLHLRTLPPKTATELLYLCSGSVPFNLELFDIHTNTQVLKLKSWSGSYFCSHVLICIKVHTLHTKHQFANFTLGVNCTCLKMLRNIFLLGPKIKTWFVRGGKGYFVNFNFMAQKIHNLTSFQTCSHIYKVDYYQNVV